MVVKNSQNKEAYSDLEIALNQANQNGITEFLDLPEELSLVALESANFRSMLMVLLDINLQDNDPIEAVDPLKANQIIFASQLNAFLKKYDKTQFSHDDFEFAA